MTIKDVENRIGYYFKDKHLLECALTHSSSGGEYNYERLESLRDRVLSLVMAHALFAEFPKEKEGGLAKRHSALVQGHTLAALATSAGLSAYIKMSNAERIAGGSENENILSDALEAILGAVYLDGGLEPARKIILDLWGSNIRTLIELPPDPKTELQEWAQARGLGLPHYDIKGKSGPDHAP